MSLRYALCSDTGNQRANNEDKALVVDDLDLFVIADGMGGHAAGEVASAVAVETVVSIYRDHQKPRRIMDEGPILGHAVVEANKVVNQTAAERDLHGMGTTLTALKFRGRTAVISHVGDTRVYQLRNGKLKQLTQDHTLVAILVKSGVISKKEAWHHPDRNVITRAVGVQGSVEPEVKRIRVSRGSRLLLSTDGLHDAVPGD
jgi:protein phosphatase